MKSKNVRACVLVAEDEAINRMYIISLLEGHGFSCLSARNGREAVEVYRSGRCEVILMDFAMPVMDGMQAIREIRRLEAGSSEPVPVIVLTAHSAPTGLEDSELSGADGYLMKPFSETDLVDAVESAVALVRARQGGGKQ